MRDHECIRHYDKAASRLAPKGDDGRFDFYVGMNGRFSARKNRATGTEETMGKGSKTSSLKRECPESPGSPGCLDHTPFYSWNALASRACLPLYLSLWVSPETGTSGTRLLASFILLI